MISYTIGSLFSGYGGLDLGVQMALGSGELAWVSDIEPGPKAILKHNHPTVENLGDVTQVDWAHVEPVDVIAGGSPCQDLSVAGVRAGMKPGTRSGLWESMFNAVRTIRPHLVVWENVLGALSANAFSLMEQREGRLGNGADRPVLRALGRVLGDLASIGYDAQWASLRASDVGACHRRTRVFVVGFPHGDRWWLDRALNHACRPTVVGEAEGENFLPTPTATFSWNTPENHMCKRPGRTTVSDLRILVENGLLQTGGRVEGRKMFATPAANLGSRGSRHPEKQKQGGHAIGLDDQCEHLLPTPTTQDADAPCASQLRRNSVPLNTLLPHLLPTPTSSQLDGRKSERFNVGGKSFYDLVEYEKFGEFKDAIRVQELTFNLPAPDPTVIGNTGRALLNPAFVEWMMGLPPGHVTSPEIGISRQLQLKALGNGVVPQQAATAIRLMAENQQLFEYENLGGVA